MYFLSGGYYCLEWFNGKANNKQVGGREDTSRNLMNCCTNNPPNNTLLLLKRRRITIPLCTIHNPNICMKMTLTTSTTYRRRSTPTHNNNQTLTSSSIPGMKISLLVCGSWHLDAYRVWEAVCQHMYRSKNVRYQKCFIFFATTIDNQATLNKGGEALDKFSHCLQTVGGFPLLKY